MTRTSLRLISSVAFALATVACADGTAPTLPAASFAAGGSGGGGVTLTITPAEATILPNGTVELSYALTNPAGHNVPSKRPVTWTSSDENIATVSSTGVVTGVADGTATITAVGGGATGTATITVFSGGAAACAAARDAAIAAAGFPPDPFLVLQALTEYDACIAALGG